MKLKELCKIKHGFAFKGKDIIKDHATKYVLVTPGNFKIGGGFKNDKCKYFSESGEIPKDYILKENDLIVTMTDLSVKSDTLGYSALVPKDDNSVYLHNQRIGLVHDIDESKVLKDYLYWFMRTKEYQQEVVASQSGTAIHHTSPDRILNIEIDLPSINNQKKIVKVLFDIEKKIKNNNEINNNLYEMLNKLYNQKYLNCEVYDEWELLTMDDVTSKFATGLNPRKNFVLGQGNNYYVTIKNMPNNQVVLDDKCDKVDDEAIVKINKRSDLKAGDLLFSGIGTIGRTYLIKKQPTNWNISESVFTIRPNERVSSEFLYLLLLSSDMQNYAISKASGSVQKGIRMADLKLYKLRVPDIKWMNNFTNTISTMINKIYENFDENIKLEQLRDTLLPKLMSGEIDLDNIEI